MLFDTTRPLAGTLLHQGNNVTDWTPDHWLKRADEAAAAAERANSPVLKATLDAVARRCRALAHLSSELLTRRGAAGDAQVPGVAFATTDADRGL